MRITNYIFVFGLLRVETPSPLDGARERLEIPGLEEHAGRLDVCVSLVICLFFQSEQKQYYF